MISMMIERENFGRISDLPNDFPLFKVPSLQARYTVVFGVATVFASPEKQYRAVKFTSIPLNDF